MSENTPGVTARSCPLASALRPAEVPVHKIAPLFLREQAARLHPAVDPDVQRTVFLT